MPVTSLKIPDISSSNIHTEILEHLGLVSGMYDELGIGDLLDNLIPQDNAKRDISIGQAVKAMVLNGLGFSQRSLYLMPHFFADKPVEKLLGAGVKAAHLQDHTLGRALDKLYEHDLEKLYALLASQSVDRLGLSCNNGHLDCTGFHVDGNYNSSKEDNDGVIQLTKGYSRDHRPDLNQVVLQLITEGQAGIPIMMQALSGNNDDKTSFRETIRQHIAQLNGDFKVKYLIADSALYTTETLRTLGKQLWISRVPETLSAARNSINSIAPELMSDPHKVGVKSLSMTYGDVKQRWLVIYSPEARQRATKTLQRQCSALGTKEMKAFQALCRKNFACEADAQAAFVTLKKTLKMTMIYDMEVIAEPRFRGKGRPAKNCEADYYVYQIYGSIASNIDEYTRRLQRKSCYILATNQLSEKELSNEALRTSYKNQQKVERGFRFLKDPMFMASTLFLKSPKRIMALMMIMTLCLLVYAALEYRIRSVLKKSGQTFPNQKGKPIANPTVRWVFQKFAGIHFLIASETKQLVLNLKSEHMALLALLGKNYEKVYAGSG